MPGEHPAVTVFLVSTTFRLRAAIFVDNLGTGAVSGTLAVIMAPAHGLAALGGVLALRVLAAVLYAAWASRSSTRRQPYGKLTFILASLFMTATSIWTVLATLSGWDLAVVGSGYLLFAFSNAVMSLLLSVRSPQDAMSLGPVSILGISTGSSLVALATGFGSVPVLTVAVVLCLAQALEVVLAGSLPVHPHPAQQKLRWGWTALSATLAFSVYAPLALAAGITARYLSPGWVAPVLLVYAASSLLAPVLHNRRNGRMHHPALLGTGAVLANLSLLAILLGPVPFLVARTVSSVAVFTVEGSLRLAAFSAGGPLALASVSFGSILGVSAGGVVFGVVSDLFSFTAATVLFTAIAALGTMVVSSRPAVATA